MSYSRSGVKSDAARAQAGITFEADGLSSPTYVAQFEGVEAISELYQIEIVLTSEDKDILAHHLGNPTIHHIADVDVGPCRDEA